MKSSTRNTSPDLSRVDNIFQKPNALPDRNHYDNNGFHTPESLMASSYEELPPLHEARQGMDSQSYPRSLLAVQGDIPPRLVLAKSQIDKQENTCCFKLRPRLRSFHTPETALVSERHEKRPPLYENLQSFQVSPDTKCIPDDGVPLFLDLVIPRIDGTTPRNVERLKLLQRPSKIGFPPGMSKFYTSSDQDHERNTSSPRIVIDKNDVEDIQSQVASSFQPQVLYHQKQDGEQAHLRPIPKRNHSSNGDTPSCDSAFVKSTGRVWSPGLFSAFETIPDQKSPKP
jgi:hypothetical protein